MCKSAAEGGQRCYSSAKKRLDSAIQRRHEADSAVLDAFSTNGDLHAARRTADKAKARLAKARAELASTEPGYREMVNLAHSLPDSPERDDVQQAIAEGLRLYRRTPQSQQVQRELEDRRQEEDLNYAKVLESNQTGKCSECGHAWCVDCGECHDRSCLYASSTECTITPDYYDD